jgi:hypothetical protein
MPPSQQTAAKCRLGALKVRTTEPGSRHRGPIAPDAGLPEHQVARSCVL